MLHSIIIRIFSAFLNLITFLLASFVIVAFDSLHQSGDYITFLIYTIPFAIAIAISGGTLVQFVRTSREALRKFWFFTIATLASLGWLYVIFVLLWGDFGHAFSMPLFYSWVVGGFVQLIYLDRQLPKPAEQKSIGLSVLMLLANPIILFFLLFAAFYESRMYEKRKYNVMSTLEEIQLKSYCNISETQLFEITGYLRNFQSIKTAHQLHQVYNNIVAISSSIGDSLSAEQIKNGDSIPDLKLMNTIVAGIHFSHNEDHAILINPYLLEFKEKAGKTPEKCDDDFIAIMIATYGEEESFSYPRWLKHTTDYSRRSSLLGDGIELNILMKIQSALSSNTEFEYELKEIREIILYDILQAACYEYDSPKIIAEINKITATIKLTEEENAKIRVRLSEFKHPSEELQLGCINKACNCGL